MNKLDLKNIKIILWDLDGTILDFYESQKYSLKKCFAYFKLGECSDEIIGIYDKINHKYWEALERGEITKKEVLLGRFYEFFEKMNFPSEIVPEFNSKYQFGLGESIKFFDGAKELIIYFKEKKYPQFLVTNGTKQAQTAKLKNSKLGKIFDEIFISEDVGYEKPNLKFFERVYKVASEYCPNIERDEIIIIGDSLTSDMKMGVESKIKTCWFNDKGKKSTDLKLDYEVHDFSKIEILNEK